MKIHLASTHRYIVHSRVLDFLMMGWMALPSLCGTPHGDHAVHMVKLCGCRLRD